MASAAGKYTSNINPGLPAPPSISQDELKALFPLPIQCRGDPFPHSNPGPTPESTETLVKLLKDNHEKFHIFFNERGFQNHTAHHLYAIYALGASPSLLEAAYAVDAEYQNKAFDSPAEITEQNWTEHLLDRTYYWAYLRFFSGYVLKEGIKATLKKFVFDPDANYVENKSYEGQPMMLDRFLSGFLHPMIHAGHGVEFNTPGMIAEGLAMASITDRQSGPLVPRDLFSTKSSTLATLTSAASSLSTKSTEAPHLFNILARMAKDPSLASSNVYTLDEQLNAKFLEDTVRFKGEAIWKYAAEWTFDTSDDNLVQAKFEELAWVVCLIYGIGGLQPGKEFYADFFAMHLVTSSLFIPSFMPYLSTSSRSILLKSYLAVVLAAWISRGRPSLSLTHFYSTSSPTPSPPGSSPTPHPDTLDKSNLNPNPWYPLLQSTLPHPNEHLPKIQRALAYYAAKFGTRKAGEFTQKDGDLEGVELLDGTLFIRVAGLTAKRLGWMREGEEMGDFDIVLSEA